MSDKGILLGSLSTKNSVIREMLSEFIGTLILVVGINTFLHNFKQLNDLKLFTISADVQLFHRCPNSWPKTLSRFSNLSRYIFYFKTKIQFLIEFCGNSDRSWPNVGGISRR